MRFNEKQREVAKELFLSYPSMEKINPNIKEEVLNIAIDSITKEQMNRAFEIVNKSSVQSGDERDEFYGILLFSLSDELKLKIEPDYFKYQNILVP